MMDRIAQCHCGALRITATGAPEWVNACHCKACQRRTGAVVHSGAYFTRSRVTIAGAAKTFARPADSGYRISFHFCPECGSNVYWQAGRFPDHIGIAVGAFADPTFPPPAFSVWEESKHAWLGLGCELERFVQGRTGSPLGKPAA
ncbi:MAG: GFA family protein [Proteobacteria bacterium]|nr:GFA family protein [Pseudomonadota bacterium]